MKMTDKRLLACADMVRGGFPCDVGTDHAYLIAHLLLEGRCSRAIGCDIREGPLAAARRTIENAGISDRVTLIRADGLDGVPTDGVSDIIIAGMGAELIADILGRCDYARSGVNLVLQPMTRAAVLRRWLSENGFEIRAERAVSDGRFCYTVISAGYGGERFTPTELFCEIGRLDPDDAEARRYIQRRAEAIKREALGALSAKSADREEYEHARERLLLAERLFEITGEKK